MILKPHEIRALLQLAERLQQAAGLTTGQALRCAIIAWREVTMTKEPPRGGRER